MRYIAKIRPVHDVTTLDAEDVSLMDGPSNRKLLKFWASSAHNKATQLTLLLDSSACQETKLEEATVQQIDRLLGLPDQDYTGFAPIDWRRALHRHFNDRLTLLKLAARAVNLEPWVDETPTFGLCVRSNWWNPLTSSKDLFNLAVQLGIEMRPGRKASDWPRARSATAEATEPPLEDRAAALRLATVKVAIAGLLVTA